MRTFPVWLGVLACVSSLAHAGPPVLTPALSPAESAKMYAAAGFKLTPAGLVSTICGTPAMPRVTYVDLNGDGRAEAVAVDKNAACYGQPGDWFTVVRRQGDGTWRAILRNVGVVTWESTRTNGWLDARLSGGPECERTARFDGSDYRQSSDCVAPASAGGPPSAAPPPAGGTPAPKAPVAADAPAANDMTVGERAAVFKAAGFTQRGSDWVGCGGESTASIEKDDVRDLNGDGKLEAIVTEGGTACYGNTGQGFYLLTQTAPGSWTLLYQSAGMPEFLATKANGWPEMEVGGPGFCFPILRWNGKTYVFARNHEYEPGACANR
jgi:hypothetical protein